MTVTPSSNTLGGECLADYKCQLDKMCGYLDMCTEVMKRAEVHYDMDEFIAAQNEEFDEEEKGYPIP